MVYPIRTTQGITVTPSYPADDSGQEQYIQVLNKSTWHQTNPSRGSRNPVRSTRVSTHDMACPLVGAGTCMGISGVDGDRPGFLPGSASALVCTSLCL